MGLSAWSEAVCDSCGKKVVRDIDIDDLIVCYLPDGWIETIETQEGGERALFCCMDCCERWQLGRQRDNIVEGFTHYGQEMMLAGQYADGKVRGCVGLEVVRVDDNGVGLRLLIMDTDGKEVIYKYDDRYYIRNVGDKIIILEAKIEMDVKIR
jgi:hypothetical protein